MEKTSEQISLGSCPTCGGPAQFIEGGEIRHVDLRRKQKKHVPEDTPDCVGRLTRQAVRGSLRK